MFNLFGHIVWKVTGIIVDVEKEEYIFLDDTGKRNIYIESFQTNSCTRPLGRVHEFV